MIRIHKNKVYAGHSYWKTEKNFVVSFPKSGRAWLENIILQYTEKDPDPLEHSIPEITQFKRSKNHYPKFNLVLTHDVADTPLEDDLIYTDLRSYFEFSKDYYKKKNVVFLSRNPRDIVVSYYWQKLQREKYLTGVKAITLDPDIRNFVKNKTYGMPKIIEFMNIWGEHIQKVNNCIVVAYEDMHKDIATSMVRIFNHFDKKIDYPKLAFAIKNSELKTMKARERAIFGRFIPENAMRCRRGEVDGYKKELDQETIDLIQICIQQNLDPFWSRYL